MNETQRRAAIKKFITDWNGRSSEKSDAQSFWRDLLSALGLENLNRSVKFEEPIDVNGHKCFVDVWIPSTKVLIEHKSRGIDLEKPAKQSDGSLLTPFEQAKRYADRFRRKELPRWIVTCNFDEFRVYDLDRVPLITEGNQTLEPQVIKYKHLAREYFRLKFLVDPNDENVAEVKISKDAARIMSIIRRGFAKKLLAPQKVSGDPLPLLSSEQRRLLNRFSVRLVFCLYAEDADVFARNQFVDYIQSAADPRSAFIELFSALNTPLEARPSTMNPLLKSFPFVGGKLFADKEDNVPEFGNEEKGRSSKSKEEFGIVSNSITLEANDEKINWFAINPTIFGALFESDMNYKARRESGMHYTARNNILKLIKPLFLDELHDEFDSIKRKRKDKVLSLQMFQEKLASLTFLDPACGSGNFLTETFIQLRALENDVLKELSKLGAVGSIRVSIDQFYGIEINDFACSIAQIAMWIADNKMRFDTEIEVRERDSYLPLKHSANITCGNALRLDWHEIVPDGVDFIIGNPPFVGYSFQSIEQKSDLLAATGLNNKKLDFVVGWFYKAADFMLGTETRAAFVSTNSIVQGEQTGAVWQKLFETVHIDFAYRTFKWTTDDDALNKAAAVQCIIVGFSAAPNDRPKIIFDGDQKIIASNINAYLLDAPNFFVEFRREPLCAVPTMNKGSQPTDGGNLIIEADQYEEFARSEPRAQKFIRPLLGAEEFIKGKARWCLWLVDATEDDLKLPKIADRLDAVRRFRLSSKKAATRAWAAKPHLFTEIRQPTTKYILVPRVSGERRKYVPMDFVPSEVIVSDANLCVPDANLFHFGVLQSIVHMAWMRVVAGYLGTSYRYSASIVYNNFPWCDRSSRIEQTAQAILDARAKYPSRSLASLYDEETMPGELRAAHLENDLAVLDAYGFDRESSEAEIVSRLMIMYRGL